MHRQNQLHPKLLKIYGDYETSSYFIKKGYYWYVQCKCKCGKKRFVRVENLLRGLSTGCHTCASKRGRLLVQGNKNSLWKGVGELSGWFFRKFLRSAKKRKIKFAISIKYCWYLFVKQKGLCALSGEPIQLCRRSNNQGDLEATASLDRIDSSKGYEIGNVQWVHKKVNKMKNNLNEQEFIDFCRTISNYRY